MTRRHWIGMIVLASASIAAAGCSVRPTPAAAMQTLDAIHVHRLDFESKLGTGAHIGGGRLVTCRHVVRGDFVRVDGQPGLFTVLAQGPTDERGDDWAIIELMGITLDAPSILEHWPGSTQPREDDRFDLLVMKSYFYDLDTETHDQAFDQEVTFITAEITSPPAQLDDRLLYARRPSRKDFKGGSGGPGFAIDAKTGEVRFSGVYPGGADLFFLGIPVEGYVSIVQPIGAFGEALRRYGIGGDAATPPAAATPPR